MEQDESIMIALAGANAASRSLTGRRKDQTPNTSTHFSSSTYAGAGGSMYATQRDSDDVQLRENIEDL